MKPTKIVFIVILFFIQFASMSGQDTYQIYLHTDRSFYLPGESVLFKAYILTDQNNGPDQMDDTLNVALIDQEGIVVSSEIFPVNNSLITGNLELPDFITEGNYILIAYTVHKNIISPEGVFSRIIEIRKNVDFNLITEISLQDTLYSPGSLVIAKIRFSGKENKPEPVTFRYHLTGSSGEILNGKGEANNNGIADLALQLPEFNNKDTLKLMVIPSYKGTKIITGIVIPTKYNQSGRKTEGGMNRPADDLKHLNILIKADKLQYGQNDNVRLDISVTDNKGAPVMANLSVSASNSLQNQLLIENSNTVNYFDRKNDLSALFSITDIRKYYTQYLVNVTRSPGKPFLVQEKNNPKKLHRKTESAKPKQDGYPGDRNIFDLLMQIKPYHIENGKITFGAMNSINNLEGALIIVDGIKMGTEASVLNDIPVPDIARITVSTNSMDIQRYSAMNNIGIIEIFMKKTDDYLKREETLGKARSSTLFWGPEIITDSSGKASVSFLNNSKAAVVLISINGIAANGMYGSGSLQYTVK